MKTIFESFGFWVWNIKTVIKIKLLLWLGSFLDILNMKRKLSTYFKKLSIRLGWEIFVIPLKTVLKWFLPALRFMSHMCILTRDARDYFPSETLQS